MGRGQFSNYPGTFDSQQFITVMKESEEKNANAYIDKPLLPVLTNIENRESFHRLLDFTGQNPTTFKHHAFINSIRLPTFAEKRSAAVANFLSFLRARNKRKPLTIPSLPHPTGSTRLKMLAGLSTRVDKFFFQHPQFTFVFSVAVNLAPGQPSREFKHIVQWPGGPRLQCKDLDQTCASVVHKFF